MPQPTTPDPKQPGVRMRRILASEPREPDLARPGQPWNPYSGNRFGPLYWTITGTLSLIINVILILVVVVLLLQKTVQTDELVGSLYNNFYRMENTNIRANVPVRTTVPVNFPLRINVETEATISQATTLTNVPVVINTGGVNIDAPATITLPAGAKLPILLDMTVQVSAPIPLDFTLPVDIPIPSTDLAAPFASLRTAFKPLYCLLNADRLYPNLPQVCE